jgi:environmental stress-induced protein Ves
VLTCQSPPLHFDGAAAPGCRLIGGPTRDFNLMLRRSAGQALLQDAVPGVPWESRAPLRGLFTTGPLLLQVDDEPPQPATAWTLLLATTPAQQRWTLTALTAGARALWLAFTPLATHP